MYCTLYTDGSIRGNSLRGGIEWTVRRAFVATVGCLQAPKSASSSWPLHTLHPIRPSNLTSQPLPPKTPDTRQQTAERRPGSLGDLSDVLRILASYISPTGSRSCFLLFAFYKVSLSLSAGHGPHSTSTQVILHCARVGPRTSRGDLASLQRVAFVPSYPRRRALTLLLIDRYIRRIVFDPATYRALLLFGF